MMIQWIQKLTKQSNSPVHYALGLLFLAGLFCFAPLSSADDLDDLDDLFADEFSFTSAQDEAPKVGDTVQLPAMDLITGEAYAADHFQGQPLIISYWASWCPHCQRQNAHLQTFYPLAQEKNLALLTISIDEDQQAAQRYLERMGYDFPAVFDSSALQDTFGRVRMIPRLLAIDAQGVIQEIIPGEMSEKDVMQLLHYAPN